MRAPTRTQKCLVVLYGFRWRFSWCPNTCTPGVQQTAHRFRIPRFAVQGHVDFVQRSCYIESECSSNGPTRRVIPRYTGGFRVRLFVRCGAETSILPKVFSQKGSCALAAGPEASTWHFGHHQLFFASRTLSGKSHMRPGTHGRCESVHDSPPKGRREVDSLSRALPDFLEPSSWIGAMNDAAQKAQALGCIVAVPPNVVLCDLGVQGEKGIQVPGFGKDVSRVAKLRGFDDHGFLNFENVFIPKKIDPARPA